MSGQIPLTIGFQNVKKHAASYPCLVGGFFYFCIKNMNKAKKLAEKTWFFLQAEDYLYRTGNFLLFTDELLCPDASRLNVANTDVSKVRV